jgi:hypothetical protein
MRACVFMPARLCVHAYMPACPPAIQPSRSRGLAGVIGFHNNGMAESLSVNPLLWKCRKPLRPARSTQYPVPRTPYPVPSTPTPY